MEKVIVFGGTGWVGHSIAVAFHEAGYDVTICSRGVKDIFNSQIPKEIKTVKGDKENDSDMSRIASGGYEIVIDSVPSEKTIELIVKCFNGRQRYLHCSSTGGYTPLEFFPGDETMPYTGFLSGFKKKVIVDSKVMALDRDKKLAATVIRPSNITGPGMVPLDNLGGRRKDFITDILNGVPLDVPNYGLTLLHPVHVKDLADAFVLAVKKPVSIGQIYNICLDKAVTINRYLEISAAAVGCKAIINYMTIDDMLKKYGSDIDEIGLRFVAAHMCFDISKARGDLGYSPRYSTTEAISQTALWAKEQSLK